MLETVHSSDLDAALTAAEQAADGFDSSADRVVCRATGRLDVMGGIADVAGALSLAATLSAGVSVAAQLRTDGGVHVSVHSPSDDATVAVWDARIQNSAADAGTDAVAVNSGDALAQLVTATVQSAFATNKLPKLSGGVTLHVWPGFDSVSGGLESAAQMATCRALVAIAQADDVSPVDLIAACQSAHLHANGFPIGPAALLSAHQPLVDGLQEIHAEGLRVVGPLPLPAGMRCIGVETGLVHDRHAEKQRDVYVETEMGNRIIDALRKNQFGDVSPVRLTEIRPDEFVRAYRDQLPTRLRGRDFIAHFGDHEIDGIAIEPGKTYKVRSRVEHHLYENHRVHEFVSTLARARNTGRVDELNHAGHLMYSSHWSYGQRCGLGSIETDLLVNLLRGRGDASGVYGARVSGFGAGGMVTVLASEQAVADGVIDAAVADLRDQSVARPVIYETNGETPGADPRWFGPNA